MIIFFHKSNTNQDGLENRLSWHIHFSPMLPECLPLHDMGVYLFTNLHIIKNNSRIFQLEHQYQRYSYLMKKFIKDRKEDLANYGILENLEIHSIQKVLSYYFLSGSTVYPSIVSICLHEGWTISGAKEIYPKYENSGDNFMCQIFVDSTHHNLSLPSVLCNLKLQMNQKKKRCQIF